MTPLRLVSLFLWAATALGCSWALAGEGRVDVRILLQNSPLAGYRYHYGRKLWPYLQVGDTLTLSREPDNVYDADAIRVDWYGFKLGYVPRRENADLARYLDRGARVDARITRLKKGSGERVRFDVYLLRNPD